MKICAACHTDLPKDSYSKKQWKLDKCQRRCKVCTSGNREVQPIPKLDNDNETDTEVIKSLDSMYLEGTTEKEISDEELFKQPPPKKDCPICFLLLPSHTTGKKYQTCCGKMICSGCIYAPVYDHQGNVVDINEKCPFCRTPTPTTEEMVVERTMKRVDLEDPIAINNLGCDYRDGTCEYPQDYTKALGYWHKAAELGYTAAYCNIGYSYDNGRGVEVDKKKAVHYYELGATKGDETARYNLGIIEKKAGNFERALKHHMIAARNGDGDSLERIKLMYSNGHATKEEYTKALQAYQKYLGEIKSKQRDKAAATYENCHYY